MPEEQEYTGDQKVCFIGKPPDDKQEIYKLLDVVKKDWIYILNSLIVKHRSFAKNNECSECVGIMKRTAAW
ncbi:hypothetical protein [Paenibacillus pabuli]|uniref:hypothetical protein n=1 Tax=Paenibacillus pabuli TaxID=1472 RepID=UPI00142FDD1E|nr:hypothetical protein [Paenibacillus pabuli]MEC0124154.1 hypothetical protein [Paenibacillus pabuli]